MMAYGESLRMRAIKAPLPRVVACLPKTRGGNRKKLIEETERLARRFPKPHATSGVFDKFEIWQVQNLLKAGFRARRRAWRNGVDRVVTRAFSGLRAVSL